MDCPQCGRALATGARRCVFCGRGTEFQRRAPLEIPAGTLPPRKSRFPWGRLIVVLLAALGVAAALLHPGLQARLRSLIPF